MSYLCILLPYSTLETTRLGLVADHAQAVLIGALRIGRVADRRMSGANSITEPRGLPVNRGQPRIIRASGPSSSVRRWYRFGRSRSAKWLPLLALPSPSDMCLSSENPRAPRFKASHGAVIGKRGCDGRQRFTVVPGIGWDGSRGSGSIQTRAIRFLACIGNEGANDCVRHSGGIART
jgi:hypothetical protein